MFHKSGMAQLLCYAGGLAAFMCLGFPAELNAQTNSPVTNQVEIILVQGTVEVSRAGQSVWDLASTLAPYCRLNPGDQIRAKDRSRATIRLSDLTLMELGPNAHFQLLPPTERRPVLGIRRGLHHLFHRDKPDEFYFRTPTASPVIRGTELVLEVAEDGTTTLHLLDGTAALTNELGQLELKSGEAAVAQQGRAPQRIAALEAVNVIQWCLYYPAVLNVEELQLSTSEQGVLANSLAAYRAGDFLAALASYPSNHEPVTDQERVFLAALVLAVGDVAGAEAQMNSLSGTDERATRLSVALRTLIAAVKGQPKPETIQLNNVEPLASLHLADSYHAQSRFALEDALRAARSAAELTPEFAIGWARVAELEFSFGRMSAAAAALQRALESAPRHAQAMTVHGFLLAGQNRTAAALAQFEEAIAVDNALGNAWLGRGLCRIRQGHLRKGVRDLLVAAALQPNRALLRGYLGKGFSAAGDDARAERELARAWQLDPKDPTAWLYMALLDHQHNRINDAIRDLERSKELNGNRQLYRSQLLLDQDRAVRQANLASLYQDAGLLEESVREAALAVNSDYANSSAHTFLANTYAARRDPGFVNLRYETAALSEYLIAQLLAPVGGSALSPQVSQQEYSRFFEQRGFGLSSETEYLSGGDWRQRGAQYGTFDRLDYSFGAYYESQNGERPNNDLVLRQFSGAMRMQLSAQDTVLLQAVGTKYESGDMRPYYDPRTADLELRIEESQEPNLFAGYHREWNPGSHTLLLLGRLHDNFRLSDPDVFIPTFIITNGNVSGQEFPGFSRFNVAQESELVAYSAELQQIWQCANNTVIVGGRYQDGDTDSEMNLDVTSAILTYPTGTQSADTRLQRAVVYAYDYWQVLSNLCLVGGVSYDWLSFPENIDLPPISEAQVEKEQISPKAGFIWQPTAAMVVRGGYARSLGGVYFDNSVRLEPPQVAGFNQAFRSAIPESVGGLVVGAEFQSAALDFSLRLPTRTYLGVGMEWLQSEGTRTIGAFETQLFSTVAVASSTPQKLEFDEYSLIANFNQLVGRDWAFGARYCVSDAELQQRLVAVPKDAVWQAYQEDEGVLHQLELFARYNLPEGFFAEAQALWFAQHSRHYHNTLLPSDVPDEEFWQFNVFAGYRFARRRAELRVGGLNLADEDYRLNPINLRRWLPRERTLLVSLVFNF